MQMYDLVKTASAPLDATAPLSSGSLILYYYGWVSRI